MSEFLWVAVWVALAEAGLLGIQYNMIKTLKESIKILENTIKMKDAQIYLLEDEIVPPIQ